MMKGFSGFGHKAHMIRVPGEFFSELLPQIDHLGEMKVVLYIFWRLQRMDERYHVWESEIRADETFMQGLEDGEASLQDALERASARGILLAATAHQDGSGEKLYMVNTPRGRAAMEGIEAGTWRPMDVSTMLNLRIERPTIYTFYEQNIGALTPIVIEYLRDFEANYPREWIEDAIRVAVSQNVRKIAYVASVLKRREEKGGRSDQSSNDSSRFLSGKYADEIET